MKYGIREVANVTFKAKDHVKFGTLNVVPGQPVLMIDTATTSSFEGSAETTYANGGRGNARLIAWEGDKTLTFTIEDALISPMGLAILSGAGFINKGGYAANETVVHLHQAGVVSVTGGKIDVTTISGAAKIDEAAPVFVMECDADGGITGEVLTATVSGGTALELAEGNETSTGYVFVDYYTTASSANAQEIQITAGDFAGSYYVEGETLWREQLTGSDVPAQFVIPNAKIQSNFTITMAATGDPSTFTFTMDCLPGKTIFNPNKEVLMALELVKDTNAADSDVADTNSVFSDGHVGVPSFSDDDMQEDSVDSTGKVENGDNYYHKVTS